MRRYRASVNRVKPGFHWSPPRIAALGMGWLTIWTPVRKLQRKLALSALSMSENVHEKIAIEELPASSSGVPAPVAGRTDSASTDSEKRQWATTRTELWAFYVYYIVSNLIFLLPDPAHLQIRLCATSRPYAQGNNGLSGFNFGPSQFQNLLFLAGYDPTKPPFSAPCGADTDCVLPYLGRVRDGTWTVFVLGPDGEDALNHDPARAVNSIVLLTNGISFALQAVVLLVIGAWADYGTWRSVPFAPAHQNTAHVGLVPAGQISPSSSPFSPSASPSPGWPSTIPLDGRQELRSTSSAVSLLR